jgi:predicted O-methyltransferase YrrM
LKSMTEMRRLVDRIPIIGRAASFLYRLATAAPFIYAPLRQLAVWLFRSKETTNFSYDLTPTNKDYLASMIADVTGARFDEIRGHMAELESDHELREHVRTASMTAGRRTVDPDVQYGRRLGWYAFVRATRPRVVVETGIDKGLGSCVLAAALMRNELEGHPGRYYGTDINPRAGYLFSGIYGRYGSILYGDSITSLEELDGVIDLFINDSDHSASYEELEYKTVAKKLSSQAVILGDNAHCTDRLLQFALATERQFVFFSEKPQNHWYPGAGIGVAFRRIVEAGAELDNPGWQDC